MEVRFNFNPFRITPSKLIRILLRICPGFLPENYAIVCWAIHVYLGILANVILPDLISEICYEVLKMVNPLGYRQDKEIGMMNFVVLNPSIPENFCVPCSSLLEGWWPHFNVTYSEFPSSLTFLGLLPEIYIILMVISLHPPFQGYLILNFPGLLPEIYIFIYITLIPISHHLSSRFTLLLESIEQVSGPSLDGFSSKEILFQNFPGVVPEILSTFIYISHHIPCIPLNEEKFESNLCSTMIRTESGTHHHLSSALIAEGLTIYNVLTRTIDSIFTKFKMVSDSQKFIRAIKTELPSKELYGALTNIIYLSSIFSSILFSYILRDSNVVAII